MTVTALRVTSACLTITDAAFHTVSISTIFRMGYFYVSGNGSYYMTSSSLSCYTSCIQAANYSETGRLF